MSDLINAIKENDINIVKSVLEQNYQISEKDEMALYYSAYNKNLELTYYLLEMNLAVSSAALAIVCQNGWFDIAEKMILKGADANPQSGSPIVNASKAGKKEIVRLLIKHGADVNVNNSQSIMLAAARGHKDVVKILIDKGAKTVVNDYSALEIAKANKRKEVIKILEEHQMAETG